MSYLLHPMYNSLSTRKRKSGKKTKELLVAERKHKKWLLSMGIDGKKTTPPPKTLALSNDLKVQDSKPIHTMGTPCLRKKDLQQPRLIRLHQPIIRVRIKSYQKKR